MQGFVNDAFSLSQIILYFSIFGLTVLGIVLLIWGGKTMIKPNKKYKKVKGTIISKSKCLTSTTCEKKNNQNNCRKTTICEFLIEYTINNKNYKITKEKNTNYYSIGDVISLSYFENEEEKADLCCPADNKTSGGFLIFFSFICFGIAFFQYYLRDNKAYLAYNLYDKIN